MRYMALVALFCVASSGLQSPKKANGQFRKSLEALLQTALRFVPAVKRDHVVLLENRSELVSYLTAWGYSHASAQETVQQVEEFAEFTIDRHLPIFVNGDSSHVRRIVRSWDLSPFREQAARVMASDLCHEYFHARYGADECTALQGQVTLLHHWRGQRLIDIADPYIASKQKQLRKACEKPVPPSAAPCLSTTYEQKRGRNDYGN